MSPTRYGSLPPFPSSPPDGVEAETGARFFLFLFSVQQSRLRRVSNLSPSPSLPYGSTARSRIRRILFLFFFFSFLRGECLAGESADGCSGPHSFTSVWLFVSFFPLFRNERGGIAGFFPPPPLKTWTLPRYSRRPTSPSSFSPQFVMPFPPPSGRTWSSFFFFPPS